MNNFFVELWNSFCQNRADYYFYKAIPEGLSSIAGTKLLMIYDKWIDRKIR